MDSQSVVNKNGFFEKIKTTFDNFFSSLNESQRSILKKVWKILSYKWQWQIALNSPFRELMENTFLFVIIYPIWLTKTK